MKVRDLLELLADYDEDMEVRIAHQPNWPLQEILQSVVSLNEVREDEDVTEDEMDAEEDAEPDVLFLVAGGHPWNGSPYAPKALWG
jgi:hypothetical protein